MNRYEGCMESPWDDVSIQYVLVCTHVAKKRYVEAFKEESQLVSSVHFLNFKWQFSNLVTKYFCRLFLRFFTENRGWTLPALFSILRDLRDLAFDVGFSNHLQTQISVHWFFFCRPITMRNTMVKRVNAWKNQLELLPKHLEIVWPTGAPHSNTPCIS